MTLDELFNHGKDFAKHAFEMQGSLESMWIAETKDGEHLPIMMPIDRDHKAAGVEALKQFMKEKGVVRYVSMVEAWSLKPVKGEDLNDVLDKGPIRDHPDRIEIVYIIAEDKYHSKSGQFHIVRPAKGKPYLSDFEEFPSNGKMEGLFTHLLESGEAAH